MLSFKSFITESEIQPLHKLLNLSQMKSLSNHPDFKTYIGGVSGSTLFARHGSRHSSGVHNFVVANNDAKYRMDVAITPRGKILNHEIHKKTDKGWDFIKGGSVDEK